MSKNEITGDTIATKAITEQYRNNYDAIFGKNNDTKDDNGTVKEMANNIVNATLQHYINRVSQEEGVTSTAPKNQGEYR